MIRLFVAPLGTTDQLMATLGQVQADARDMLIFCGEVKQEFLEGKFELITIATAIAIVVAIAIFFIVTRLRTKSAVG